MENYEILRKKLEAFIRRYYLNELLKGVIFFVAIGLLYFLGILLIEYFLWLEPFWRTILFWGVVLVETLLLLKFILYPLLKLFRLSKGLDYAGASRIIGSHFPEVSDKLLNLLQLKKDARQSELLLAGIDQKARELSPVPFSMAVDFRKNLPYLKYAAIPILIFLAFSISGNSHVFSDSYERVVHYKMAYEPPAPFSFALVNPDLKVRENEDLEIEVRTMGNVIPENASVHLDGQSFFMNEVSPGVFRYTFESVNQLNTFYFSANGVQSRSYDITVIKVPRMTDFRMELDYPEHTGLKTEVKDGTGNVVVPEGTLINWNLKAVATNEVAIRFPDSVNSFTKTGNDFNFQKRIFDAVDYQITTSNDEVREFEKLAYSVNVVKDAWPELEVENKKDSINSETEFFFGKVSDDYGISRVQLVIFPAEDPENITRRRIDAGKGTYGEFLMAFPDTLSLEPGVAYDFYFEAFDNDALNNYKSVRTRTFSFRKMTREELQDEKLDQQNNALQGIGKTLEERKLSQKELQEFERLQKEQSQLSYSDRRKLENYLERQKQQNEMMKNFSEKLKRSLDEEEGDELDEQKEKLKERLENNEERLRENEELLKELEKYTNKIEEEGLREKLEELSRNNQNQERSMEQLLELTRRYYVEQKAAIIGRELDELGKRQEELPANDEENTPAAQEELNDAFEKIRKDLEELEKENQGLKKPVETGADPEKEEEIGAEQEKAGEMLQQEQKEGAKEHQENAGQKMREMSKKMEEQRMEGSREQMQEDAQMLRQILDNLVTFSFEQEDLMERFKNSGRNSPGFAGNIRRQNVLRENFQHIDDSLYSLALRNPMITEKITSKLTDVDYDLDKSLERLAQNQIPQGTASQQYVVTGANDLAYFLSDILGNMQDMMSQSGQGGGSSRGKQLPDIIQEQGELNEQMQKGMQKNKGDGEDGEGEEQEGEGKPERGQGQGEEENGELFEIYQRQQMLRKELEERLKENGLEDKGKSLMREMEKIEEDILMKGFNENTMKRMLELEHKLLELEDARLEQGEKEERESRVNRERFENTTNTQIIRAKEYFNTTEILNRQTLPLRQIYKLKVKEYFERGDN